MCRGYFLPSPPSVLKKIFYPELCIHYGIDSILPLPSQVALVVKNPPANRGDIRDMGLISGWEEPLEEEMATHSSVLCWEIPRTEEPGGLQSMGSEKNWT